MSKRNQKWTNIRISMVYIVLAVFTTLALHSRWGIYGGEEGDLLSRFLKQWGGAFQTVDFVDVIVLTALLIFYAKTIVVEKLDRCALSISGIFSFLYIICREYREYNSLQFLFGSRFSILLSGIRLIGYSALFYALLIFLKRKGAGAYKESASDTTTFLYRFFWPLGWCFILLCYIPWLLLSYPGSGMPDTVVQFQNYLGDKPWSMWQPPLSSLLMGWCYSLGKAISNANFGFFLYALLQSVAAAGIFSFAMNKLKKLDVPLKYCVIGVLFYGLVPMWGAYAQWVEKDFLFAAVCVLQTVFVMETFVKKTCSGGVFAGLLLSSLLCAFLRNNGIYAVLPALIALCFYVGGRARKQVITVAVVVFLLYEGSVRALLPALGVEKTSVSETIGFMFQQTARYVNAYEDELTEEEKEVLIQNFQSMDIFARYDPRINDPVKIYYNHTAPKEYFALWLKQFLRHPGVYIASYLNGAYGYLAPVDTDIGAYVMTYFTGYLADDMGLYRNAPTRNVMLLQAILNPSSSNIFIKYFTAPGAYTWCLVVLLFLLYKKKAKGTWIVFLPGLVTILVCTVSPLACAMRYALPVAAMTPFLIGWTIYSLFITD